MKNGCRFKIKKIGINNYRVEDVDERFNNLKNKNVDSETILKCLKKTEKKSEIIQLNKVIDIDDYDDLYDQLITAMVVEKLKG